MELVEFCKAAILKDSHERAFELKAPHLETKCACTILQTQCASAAMVKRFSVIQAARMSVLEEIIRRALNKLGKWKAILALDINLGTKLPRSLFRPKML
jgi:hypothetical protein